MTLQEKLLGVRSNPSQSQSEIPATNQGAVAKVLQEIVTAKENSSKVVDENGEPLVAFHSGAQNINIFSREYDKKGIGRQFWGKGFYFSTAKSKDQWARMYQSKTGEEAQTYPVFLNIKHPSYSPINGEITDTEYDGVVLPPKETVDGETDYMYIASSPSQIKSATDNIGTFDPNNPDIRYQKGKLEHQSTNPVSKTTAYVAEMVGLKKAGIEVNVLAEDESYMMDEYDTSVLTPYLYGKLHSDIKYVLNSDEKIQQNPFVVLQTDKYDYLCQTDEDYNVKILNRYDKDGRLTNTNRSFVEEGDRGEISNNDSLNSPSEKGTHRGVNTNANRSTEDKRTSNGNTRIRGGLRDIGEVWVRPAESLPLKNPKGNRIYGWSIGGEIYLTPDGINSETPLHEYTHLWSIAMQRGNRAAWDSVVSLLKGTKAWKGVVKDKGYANLDTDDKIASEVLSRLSGAHGAKLIEQESEGKIEGDTDSARAQTILANIKKALETFWKWVGTDLFNIRSFSSVDEVKDRVLYDFVNGTDLGDVYSDNVEYQKEASESLEDYDLYRTVEDEDTIEFLEGQPSVTTYRSMALIDGKLYPPMSSKEMGSKKLRNPSELGKWEEAEEAPWTIGKV